MGLNTEADDVLLAICNTLIALFDRLYSHRGRFTPSASTFLDPDDSFFTSLLSTLVALVTTDSVALQTGAGNKYNTKWKELQSAYNVQMVVVGELNLIE